MIPDKIYNILIYKIIHVKQVINIYIYIYIYKMSSLRTVWSAEHLL